MLLHGVRGRGIAGHQAQSITAGAMLLMKASADECTDWGWYVQEARAQLGTAVQRLGAAGFETPDWAAAQHQWRLGQVLWELGDAHHGAAKAAWMQAIAVEGPCQVRAAGTSAACADVCHPRVKARYCSCCCQMCISRVCTLNEAFGSYQ